MGQVYLTAGSMKRSWMVAIALLLVMGISLRGANLDRKVYWHDEVFTSLRVVGHQGQSVQQAVFSGEPLTAASLLQYQTLSADRGWGATWQALVGHPEHPPLYYVLSRFWVQRFGDSVSGFRSLAVVLSLLVFPAFYWLGWELFRTHWVPQIGLMLLAVSPIHLLYAQEAREYSLWTVTILAASAALLWAMRCGRWWRWGVYALALTAGFYTSLLMLFLGIAHSIWIGLCGRRQWRSFGFALLATGVMFSPWAVVMVVQAQRLESVTQWTRTSGDWSILVRLWGLHLSSVFLDLGLPVTSLYSWLVPPLVVGLGAIAALRFTLRTPLPVRLFVLLLVAVPMIGLIGPDLILGGQRSATTRYFFPTLVGLQLVVAYWIASKLASRHPTQQLHGQVVLVSLLVLGTLSCSLIANADTWWNKSFSAANGKIAQVINQTEDPLVLGHLTPTALGDVISLSYDLRPAVPLQLVVLPELPTLSRDYGRVFLYKPFGELIDGLAQTTGRQAEIVEQPGVYELWTLAE